jgi:D-glycero-alpha-D-manno-heptose-7-phosphate kinase
MIISRTPLRMSFAGGGSDIPAYYREFGGAVISTAINKYIYVNVNKKFDDGIRIGYSVNEEVQSLSEIAHPIVRESLRYLDISGGVEITSIADIPSSGTGLGSSSAFTVGLLHALSAFKGNHISSEHLAVDACTIELDRCNEPIGKQDQYASAYGGFNLYEFHTDDAVVIRPIVCSKVTLSSLQKNILVFYTGRSRSASQLLRAQISAIEASAEKKQAMHRMVRLAYELADELGKNNVDSFGQALDEGWHLKKSLDGDISSPEIDSWYQSAKGAGALGGRILGAGAGGFLMVYAHADRHSAIIHALSPLRLVDMSFDPLGSRIIFYQQPA